MSRLHALRARLSEPYRIRHGYGLSPIRNKRELRALYDFCKRELAERREFNVPYGKRDWVFTVTVAMYEREDVLTPLMDKRFNPEQRDYVTIYDFIEDHVGWYWS